MIFMLYVGKEMENPAICQLMKQIGQINEKHKLQGGTFGNYKDKKHLPFTETAIGIHLEGKATHGIYPLLKDNTSFFIAVDFDKTNWEKSILKLYKTCGKYEIQSYIEKSRSGKWRTFMGFL